MLKEAFGAEMDAAHDLNQDSVHAGSSPHTPKFLTNQVSIPMGHLRDHKGVSRQRKAPKAAA